MCNIWKRKPEKEISPEILAKLPESLDDINISGGEPFLRKDLVRILDIVFDRCDPSKVVISTNGLLPEVITARVKEIMSKPYGDRVEVAISLDGIGAPHNYNRGIPDAYDRAVKTIDSLQAVGFKNIGLGYTFVQGTEESFAEVKKLADKKDLNLGVTIAHNSDNYFGTQDNDSPDPVKVKSQLKPLMKDKLQSLKKNELGKCYYLHGLNEYARTAKPILPCSALRDSFFIDPKGYIYPCNILNHAVGNLVQDDFSAIWESESAYKVRNTVKNCPTPCWMVCTAKPSIKRNKIKAGWWLVKSKIFGL
jgi:radical SAM protein with 4Fe4S-binding SPASM domain